MPLTFNPKKYSELLAQYQPKLIRTETENEQALAIANQIEFSNTQIKALGQFFMLILGYFFEAIILSKSLKSSAMAGFKKITF